MNLNEECLLKYLQDPEELFGLDAFMSEIDADYAETAVMPDYMLQHIY